MRKLVLLFFFYLAGVAVNGQDVIVTVEGDTIECSITRITDDFIHFSIYDTGTGILLTRSRLPMSKVATYSQDVVEPSGQTPEPESSQGSPPIDYESLTVPKFRFSFNTGFTYQVGGYDVFPKSYRDQVQTLWHFGGDLHYFPLENIGVGVKYNQVFTPAEEEFLTITGGTLLLEDELIQFNFLALSFMYRVSLSEDQFVNYSLALGRIDYRTDFKLDGVRNFEEGSTLGFAIGLSYDLRLADRFGVGLGGEANFGTLSEINANGVNVPANFEVTRVEITVGLRFFE